jgi:hypothetical protein
VHGTQLDRFHRGGHAGVAGEHDDACVFVQSMSGDSLHIDNHGLFRPGRVGGGASRM